MARPRYTLMIDCTDAKFRDGVRFWSQALGSNATHSGDPTDPYVELPGAAGDVHVEIQRVGGPSRYHLDLYAPDVEVEVRRLEQLGAKRVAKEEDWWVMRAPTGHLFCVIPDDTQGGGGGVEEYEEDFFAGKGTDRYEPADDYEEDYEDEPEPQQPEPRRYPPLRIVRND